MVKMKKIISVLLVVVVMVNANAQVHRKHSVQNAKDTAATMNKADDKMKKKDMMRELNLTKQQRLKLKEMRQAGKAKMDEIENDPKLSDSEKKARLKELKKQQMEGTMSVLNDEQKAKMKTMQKEQKGNKKGNIEMKEE